MNRFKISPNIILVDRYEEQCGNSNHVAALEGLMNSLQISPTA
jgi:hypothetical protein